MVQWGLLSRELLSRGSHKNKEKDNLSINARVAPIPTRTVAAARVFCFVINNVSVCD
jgi:hypothetical protein